MNNLSNFYHRPQTNKNTYKTMKKILAFFAVMVAVSSQTAFSQDITLTFTGARTDGAHVVLDSVQVQNITRSWTETVVYPDTVLTFSQSGSGIADVQGVAAKLTAYPNPFNGATNVAVTMPQSGNATVQVFNLAGQKVVEQAVALETGNNLLEVRLQEPQVHILAVTTPHGRSTIKLINSQSGAENAILSRGTGVIVNKLQSAQTFQIGDTLRITGFTSQLSTISQSRMQLQCPAASANFTLLFDTIPENGILPGTFSVSADDEVRFAKGNLQYTTTGTHAVAGGGTAPGTWRFASHQWDTIGALNRNVSSNYTGWIDLFGWGTSGYHNTNDPYNTFYQPYSIGYYTPIVNATFNYYGYGPSTNMQDTNFMGTSANYDWGIYNAISNGGNQPGLWRTLTQTEWAYLLESRTTTSGVRYAKATVNGVKGVIITPDNWNTATFYLDSVNTPSISFTANVITAAQWVSTLESAGCVFLPAAGSRTNITVFNVNVMGTYWASTCWNSAVSNNISFQRGYCSFSSYSGNARYYGHSVRLVTNSK